MDGRLIAWGVAELVQAGEAESGDLYLIKPFVNGVLLAAVDGLGHGAEAAKAAKIAVATLKASNAQEPITALLALCNERLRKTRGVAMSLASINALVEKMSWSGVGNVEGVLLRAEAGDRPAREWLPLRGGVVGYRLPPLSASVITIKRNDVLIFATDGIRSDFAEELVPSDSPQQIADRILARSAKGTDDALVLVARYLGRGS